MAKTATGAGFSVVLAPCLGACGPAGGGGGDAGSNPSDASSGADGAATTRLPIECRRAPGGPSVSDPACSADTDNSVGTGPAFEGQFGEGFLEGTNIIFTAGPVLGGPWAVYSLDPSTKVRTVLSGTYRDPRTGATSVGSGPDITCVYDAARGADGSYYFFVTDSAHTSSTWGSVVTDDTVILRVDPRTGARTEVLDFALTSAACTTRSGQRLYPDDTPIFGHDNQDALAFSVGADGTFYVAVGRDLGGARLWGGIAAFRNGHCTLLSVYDSMGTDNVGTGIEFGNGAPVVVRVAGSTIYAISRSTYAVLQIDPTTGNRSVVSTQDPHGAVGTGTAVHPDYLQFGPDGSLWTSGGGDIAMSSLTRIDPATGNRTGYVPSVYAGGGANAHQLYGVDPTRPFVYFSDHNETIGVLEHTTGNYNILME